MGDRYPWAAPGMLRVPRAGTASVARRGGEPGCALRHRDDRARLDEDGRGADQLRARRLRGDRAELGLEGVAGGVVDEDVAALEPLTGPHPPGLEPQPRHRGETGV